MMGKKLSKQFTADVAGALVGIARERLGVSLDDGQGVNVATALARAGQIGKNFEKSLDVLTKPEYHRLIARFDIRYFGKRYFPEAFTLAFAPCQLEWMQLWQDVEAGKIQEHIIIMGQRNFGKSTYFAFLFPMHTAVFGLRKSILIIGTSVEKATEKTLDIREQLEGNELLAEEIGEFTPVGREVEWAKSRFIMRNGVRLVAAGPKAGYVRGALRQFRRPDLCVIDDLEKKEESSAAAIRESRYRFVTETVEPALDKSRHGQLVYNGTLTHYDSALARLVEFYGTINEQTNKPRGIVRKYSAQKENGESEWPALYSREDLDDMRKNKPRVYWIEMQGIADNPEQTAFRNFHYYEWVDATDKDLMYFGGVDLQEGHEAKHDYFTIVTLGWCEEDGCAYLMPYIRSRPHFTKKKELVREEWERYEWQTLTIEQPSGGTTFQEALEEAYPDCPGLVNCVDILPQGNRGKKELRIENNLDHPVGTGMIRFTKDQGEIREELQWLGHAKDDLADALEVCWHGLQEWRKTKRKRRRIRAYNVSVKQGVRQRRDTANGEGSS